MCKDNVSMLKKQVVVFKEQLESHEEKIGKGKAEDICCEPVADYKSFLPFHENPKEH